MARSQPFSLAYTFRVIVLAVLVGFVELALGDTGMLVASKEPGWPQWRGPRRDGICDEKGLLQSWPEGGPKLVWAASDIGFGYAAPIIANRTLFITGDIGDELHLFAFDLNGRLKWRAMNGRSWQGSYPGARASCTFDEGYLYHMNAHGRVACLDAQTGREVWAADVFRRFEGKNLTWAASENLLVDGPRVIVTAGGKMGVMAALDKKTGQTVWTSAPLLYSAEDKAAAGQTKQIADGPSYSSPILFELGGRRQIVACSTRHVFGVDAATGQRLWHRPVPTRYEVIGLTPVLYKDAIFITAPDGQGGKLFRLRNGETGVQVEEVWTASLDTCHGGVLLVGNHLYGSWYRASKGWGCLDAETGKVLYQSRELAMGSAIWADGRFYCLSQEGIMALVQADSRSFDIVSQFRLVDGRKDDVWTHPVICDGRLYLRYHEKLYCYDIKAR